MRVAGLCALAFGVLFALYLGLAGALDPVELALGIVCAGFGAVFALGLSRIAHRTYRLRPPPRAILRPLGAVLPETAVVGFDLVRVAREGARGQRGSFVRQSFEPGGEDPRSAGRRALAVLGVSLAPRAVVVRGERSQTLILHTMPSKPASGDPRWPA